MEGEGLSRDPARYVGGVPLGGAAKRQPWGMWWTCFAFLWSKQEVIMSGIRVLSILAIIAIFAVSSSCAEVTAQEPVCPSNGNRTDDPDAYCDTCGGQAMVNIAAECAAYGGWSQSCCQCIAQHESGGNAHACNRNVGGSIDAGLWQINSCNWNACNGGRAPCDTGSNRSCAMQIWKWGGGTWKAWSTCSMCGCCHSH